MFSLKNTTLFNVMGNVFSGVTRTTSVNQHSAPADDPEKMRSTGYRELNGSPSSSTTVNNLLDNI
jgi:hypothetical protein